MGATARAVRLALWAAAASGCSALDASPASVAVPAGAGAAEHTVDASTPGASAIVEREAVAAEVESDAVSASCPVRLLDVAPAASGVDGVEGLRLLPEGVAYLEGLRPPLYLVSALGVYRGGKSMMLNRLRGLKTPYRSGFGVGHGQQTFTRGIDVCAEEVPDIGTIVWMDTEGLFSAEDARSAYGPKLFSLALLFSSTVLLNSVKVLNDQFFAFFGEQQQVARVLRRGLQEAGIPGDRLLHGNLSVFWVLQQPIQFDSEGSATRAQLETFLGKPGEETRAYVRDDFEHHLQEVPVAAADVRAWGRLEELSDEELLPDYVRTTSSLRKAVLASLSRAQPLQATSVTKQLAMYVDLVSREQFSGALAREAFEEAEVGHLCGEFTRLASEAAGELPSTSLELAFRTAKEALEPRKAEKMREFHLGAAWAKKLDRCLEDRIADLRHGNGDRVLALWYEAVAKVAEQGNCFFLGSLARLLREYVARFGPTFSASLQARAVEFASALQRARLVDCVRLRDFLWPFVPWLVCPVCSFYLRGGTISGVFTMALHAVVVAGMYVLLQLTHQLPRYLDVNYPVLHHHPWLLGVVMRAPPLVPWGAFAWGFGLLGACRSAWYLFRQLRELAWYRSPGSGHEVAQLLNLELKVNMLLKRTEASFQQALAAATLDAAVALDACIEASRSNGAAVALAAPSARDLASARGALLKLRSLLKTIPEGDDNLAALLESCGMVASAAPAAAPAVCGRLSAGSRLLGQLAGTVRRASSGGVGVNQSAKFGADVDPGGTFSSNRCGHNALRDHGLYDISARREWAALPARVAALLQAVEALMSTARSPAARQSKAEAESSAAAAASDDDDYDVQKQEDDDNVDLKARATSAAGNATQRRLSAGLSSVGEPEEEVSGDECATSSPPGVGYGANSEPYHSEARHQPTLRRRRGPTDAEEVLERRPQQQQQQPFYNGRSEASDDDDAPSGAFAWVEAACSATSDESGRSLATAPAVLLRWLCCALAALLRAALTAALAVLAVAVVAAVVLHLGESSTPAAAVGGAGAR
eukprot:TRINITY_DN1836_c0_g3_i1.p1 TRINITY_DN1836_c0_g3~~TRINITY_DN1836_c0_g3_i1.p1  ORF type:complete len:1072 (-),score=261.34 TRINITY_DN1836_c0_g3_i1:101-3238(-)